MFRKFIAAVPIVVLAIGGSTACATKKFVRTSVGEVNEKVDSQGRTIEETQERVVYLYGPTQNQVGRLSINKKDGAIHGEGVNGMSEETSWHHFGTRAKVLRLVKEAFSPAPAPVPPGP